MYMLTAGLSSTSNIIGPRHACALIALGIFSVYDDSFPLYPCVRELFHLCPCLFMVHSIV